VRCTSTTRVKEIIKKLSTEKNWTKRASLDRLSPYADDDIMSNIFFSLPLIYTGNVDVPQTESSYGLFLPADKAGLLPSDEVKLEEDYAIYLYDMAPVVTNISDVSPANTNSKLYIGKKFLLVSIFQDISISESP
jgi:hypothetical protein